MPNLSPEAYLEKVHDRETFLDFLASLEQDFVAGDESSKGDEYVYGVVQNATGWYNGSIDAFLEASIAAAEAVGPTRSNPWQECAAILLGGKYYE